MEIIDIQLRTIMRLFQGFPFPRTVSTYATNGRQITVNSIDEAYELFTNSDFTDCRINAFPAGNINADFVMMDLDLAKFKTEELLIKALNKTTENIGKDFPGTVPLILFTGGGYHVYQPIELPILEEESVFRFFDNPSTGFIRYAAKRWTDKKNDSCNNPSVKSCMLRVPGSINSKNNATVRIVQEWNGRRPKANKLLFPFFIESATKRLAERRRYPQQQEEKQIAQQHPMTSVLRQDMTGNSIVWIDSILANGGMSDYRKLLVDLVLVPYLVNVKHCEYADVYNKMIGWLDKCSKKRKLDFSARLKVKYALNRSRQNGIRPMRLDTMKENYSEIYNEVIMK